ncbi:hypothetical protein DMUE_0311 [Dictyocoela muelleri]|nr:hypothetical protein DMUE_0311 [Dictyocoela muelleri]
MRIENTDTKRKRRTQITKEKTESFLDIIDQEKTQVEICRILKLSKSTLQKMINKYHTGDFDDLKNIKTTEQLKKGSKKDYEIEKSVVRLELEANPCTTLKPISININNNNGINLSIPSIYRRIKMLRYTQKFCPKSPLIEILMSIKH